MTMDKNELFQALTLWFAAIIVVQTGSGTAHSAVMEGVGIVALSGILLVPPYLLVRLPSLYRRG